MSINLLANYNLKNKKDNNKDNKKDKINIL